MKTKALLFIAILLLVTLACGSNSGVTVNAPGNNDNNNHETQNEVLEPTKPPLGSSRSNPAPFGSEVTADDMKFVVLSSTRPATDIVMEGNMFNTEPEEGQEYIFVDLQVTCMKSSDQECSVSTFNIKLVGSAGVERDAEWFVSGVDGLFEDNQFYGGASISGQIPFIINVDETDLLLVYEPLFGDTFYLAIE
jgi:uncharacterized protein YcfL